MAYLPTQPATKKSRTQHLGNITGQRGAGLSTLTPGDPAMHSLNHYGKSNPLQALRGGKGGVGPHPRYGGLGPEKYSKPGPSGQNYSMTNVFDTE